MSTNMKLISKEFLKQGKVTQLIKLDPSAEQRLLNEISVGGNPDSRLAAG